MKKIRIVAYFKKALSIFLLLFFLWAMVSAFQVPKKEGAIGQVMIDRGYQESGAKNIVTAIYLDYRLYDTFFEALILMISVSGVVLLAEAKGEEEL